MRYHEVAQVIAAHSSSAQLSLSENPAAGTAAVVGFIDECKDEDEEDDKVKSIGRS